MKTNKFKTESKQLLDLMINSIYTNREIFLRELISNASDAMDKYHYLSLTKENYPKGEELKIDLSVNKDMRSITITDNGVGFTYEELVDNLGTIAKSGSKAFKEALDDKNKSDVDLIGQFGVGFYSAFMVAKKVVVITRSLDSETAYMFSSNGKETYTINETVKENHGSEITLYLRDNTDEVSFDEFIDQYTIKSLVKKYSDYVRYPIQMEMTHTHPKYDDKGKEIKGESETVNELETLNSMIPLWKKSKSEITEEELNNFYMQKFGDYEAPLMTLNIQTEGTLTYNSLLFIPSHVPNDMYSDKYEKGLQLYTKGVFIMDKCKELIPDYLKFVKGIVDSSDLSLNISREILQQNHQLTSISANIEKKLLSEFSKTIENDREKYEKFFDNYGVNFKYAIYESFGAKKESLQDLILYKSYKQDKYVTLDEYVKDMKENQKEIYYASGKSKASIEVLPQMDLMKKEDYDVLILSDDIDEFVMMFFNDYKEHKFKSIAQGDIDLLSKEEKEALDKVKEEKKPLLDKIKELLKDKVSDVRLSERLVDSPVCLISGDGVSFEMEKVLSTSPYQNKAKAERILEINPNHEVFKAICKVYETSPDELEDYADLLYSQALLIEGLPLNDPVAFSNKMCDLMIKSSK